MGGAYMNNFDNISMEMREDERVILIKDHFSYDPETGKVYHKEKNISHHKNKYWNTRYAGKEAGFFNGDYFKVSIGGKKTFYVHQVAFACMVSYIPKEIDHEDKCKINNKWNNLRDAISHSHNASNRFMEYNNQSGLKGVSWDKWNKKWRMDIAFNHIKYYSFHKTKEEAHEAYKLKSAELHKEFGCYE